MTPIINIARSHHHYEACKRCTEVPSCDILECFRILNQDRFLAPLGRLRIFEDHQIWGLRDKI